MNMLSGDRQFRFGNMKEETVLQLKNMLSDKPVLKLYKVKAETELHMDVSKHGYCATLLQWDSGDSAFHPV